MKKLLLILLSLTLCACQAPTKSTTSTSKKACDVTSEEEKCNEKDNGIDIQYVKVRDEEKNRLYTDEQKAIIEPYIQDYMSNNDEGILTLYVPLVLVVKNGKVIDGHEGTLESHDATERKMTNDEKEQLTKIYTKLMSEAK